MGLESWTPDSSCCLCTEVVCLRVGMHLKASQVGLYYSQLNLHWKRENCDVLRGWLANAFHLLMVSVLMKCTGPMFICLQDFLIF